MKKITIGIVAHVDAGKTTLTEALLYKTGKLREPGRVDKKNSYLDTEKLERKRGITIVSKQAIVETENCRITIIDTPGHLDFASETERVLDILDIAVFLISAPDGMTENGRVYFELLKQHNIPILFFINKMDQTVKKKQELIKELGFLNENFINMNSDYQDIIENFAATNEDLMEKFLNGNKIELSDLRENVRRRESIPVYFGSALHMDGIDELINGICELSPDNNLQKEFGARVFKILHNENGERLTFLKVTGGELCVKSLLNDEKVNQIRIYSGEKYETVTEAGINDVVAVTGPCLTYAGEGLGIEPDREEWKIQPVLSYGLRLPENVSPKDFFSKMKELTEENPMLNAKWDSDSEQITVFAMGSLQLEILKDIINERTGVDVTFDDGRILYRETIANRTYCYGHYEPLRHYAEVQLMIEPLSAGSGIEVATNVSASNLKVNYQKVILSALEESLPVGILTGSQLTDMKITLTAGEASVKHSIPMDFKEAVRRAVRAGLMKTGSVLLEPYFQYRIECPQKYVGRIMHELTGMYGTCEIKDKTPSVTIITGKAPAVLIRKFNLDLTSMTCGSGHITMKYCGYYLCHNAKDVIDKTGYNPDADVDSPSSSIFVNNGMVIYVPWYEAEHLMHLNSEENKYFDIREKNVNGRTVPMSNRYDVISTDEIDRIIRNASFANSSDDKYKKNTGINNASYVSTCFSSNDYTKTVYDNKKAVNRIKVKKKYMLVDGYNIIHAWSKLSNLTEETMDGARFKLLDIMSNYQAVKGIEIIVVFDAYRVHGHYTTKFDYQNIHVVYTKEAETADQYIEKFTIGNSDSKDITIVTSDGLVQLIIRGAGANLMSATELEEEVEMTEKILMENFKNGKYN